MSLNLINLDRLNRFWSDLKTWLASHYATKEQGDEADTAVQGVKLNGTLLAKDGSNQVDVNLGSIVAPTYSSSSTYAVNDFVLYQDTLYRCTTAISTAESWTAAHWTAVHMKDLFNGSAPGIVPAPTSANRTNNSFLSGMGDWNMMEEVSDADVDSIFVEGIKIGDHKYPYVQIGNQLWITQNLDYKWAGLSSNLQDNSPAAGYYNNDESTYGLDGTYKCGLLYNGYASRYLRDNRASLLPEGWHIPSSAEWDALINNLGGSSVAATKLKAINNSITSNWPSNWNGTDDYGFNALPTGFYESGDFKLFGERLYYWTSSSLNNISDYFKLIGPGSSILSDNTYLYKGFSLRLVKTLT